MGSVVDFNAVRSAKIIRRALVQVQDAAWANFSSTDIQSDAERIERIRRIVLHEEVQCALRCDNEPVCVAYVDTIRAIVFRHGNPRIIINALRSVLAQPVLKKVLGKTQDSRMPILHRPHCPPETA
jgi:hypothetical protein